MELSTINYRGYILEIETEQTGQHVARVYDTDEKFIAEFGSLDKSYFEMVSEGKRIIETLIGPEAA